MLLHVIQHVPFEDIGNMANWFHTHGIELRYTRCFAHDPFPDIVNVDGVIIMGGPMSVHDEAQYPWLIAEKAFIRAAMTAKKPMLGVCLGAQLLAQALGANVFKHTCKEIGWLPVHGTTPAQGLILPSVMSAFHWHGETFDLPPDAQQLARTESCEQQAFQYGEHLIGLQYHLEMTADGVEQLITHAAEDYAQPSHTVQTPAQLRAANAADYAQLAHTMSDVLTYLFSR